jgi:hypothetical protein
MTWPVKRSKYGNRKSVSGDGTKFDSAGEMRRWFELQLLEKSGAIRNLRRQVQYELFGLGGTKICAYVADFEWFEGNLHIIEDYKSVRTAEFRLKEKLFKDNYPGITFRLTGAWQKIEDKARKKARDKYAAKKMLTMMGETE